jgi:aminoglycoside phosphotransferase (APT) family kinase protein
MRFAMTSSADAVRAVAERLCGAPLTSLDAVGGGGNNRVYRAVAGGVTYALKSYPPQGADVRDRLAHEFGALTFMNERLGGAVPRPFGADRERGFALYEWIAGTRIARREPGDVPAAVSFAAALHGFRDDPAAAGLPPAAEAVFGNAGLIGQLDARFGRLRAVAGGEPELARFLVDRVEPAYERLRRPAASFAELPPGRRTLSPSDFGFHNAIRRLDGRIAFIDFEYFGWDDPVKLVADFCWHPGMALDAPERELFTAEMSAVYAADDAFAARLAAYLPLIGLRWIAIVLNEFLPDVWERRVFAGRTGDWSAAKRQQLNKAEALFERLGGASGA